MKDRIKSGSDAVFLGWQETLSGVAIALYNITACNHPSFGSTVTDRVLRELDLKVPGRERYKGKK